MMPIIYHVKSMLPYNAAECKPNKLQRLMPQFTEA
jgi:hypothetical protein